jgi:shikimate kinase
MAFPERIYLTGFMASGKSTVGLIVANTIGYQFADLDEVIVLAEGRSVEEMFRESGESYFRDAEAAALRETALYTRSVTALGGGTLITDAAYAVLPAGSTVVYLDTKPAILARRLYYGRGTRPLMLDADGNRLELAEVEARVVAILAEREKYYRRADIVVRSGERSIGKTVDAVVGALRNHGSSSREDAVRSARER